MSNGSHAANESWPTARTGWYATLILTLAYTLSFIDRQILNLLVEPVKADLSLSDTRISLLQGAAFVGTYVLMSVPIGRLVDRFKRVYVLIGGMLTWSIATIGCGMSGSFAQLLSARMFVGAGESSVTPAAWSLLADYFPRDRLARPVSVFLMGPYLGAGLALIIGAEVIEWAEGMGKVYMPFFGELAPWQFTFIVVGLPGILLSALLFTVHEPERKGRLQGPESGGAASFFVTLPLALVASALQTVTPNEMRGLIAGLYVVTVNVIGLAVGPTVVALLTDRLFGDPQAVGKSLSLLSLGVAPIAIALLASGMKPYRARMEASSRYESSG